MKTWQIYTFMVLVVGLVVLQIWNVFIPHQAAPALCWEYGCKDMIDVDPSKTKFEDWNEWTKEGWEPVIPLYQKEIDGSVRILVRRPRSDQ